MIYLFLANGFEEVEALTPLDIIRRAGLDIQTVGVGGKVITGSHTIPVTADITENEICLDKCDCVILPGGMPGTLNLQKNETVQNALKIVSGKNGHLCAICAAPSVLGQAGYLVGKKATCYPGFEDKLTGAILQNAGVVTDGTIITAKGMGVAKEFGLAIVQKLCGNETAHRIEESIQRM